MPYSAGWDYGKRSSARREFLRKSGFPTGRPGYVVDYIVPLSQGGADTPANMHFVPVEQARVTR
ncbi:MAG: HNH endonuclease [Elusimicrobia bacterium]|nr:HNH endonuclease [Elusimicrobiota bacterium]